MREINSFATVRESEVELAHTLALIENGIRMMREIAQDDAIDYQSDFWDGFDQAYEAVWNIIYDVEEDA